MPTTNETAKKTQLLFIHTRKILSTTGATFSTVLYKDDDFHNDFRKIFSLSCSVLGSENGIDFE